MKREVYLIDHFAYKCVVSITQTLVRRLRLMWGQSGSSEEWTRCPPLAPASAPAIASAGPQTATD